MGTDGRAGCALLWQEHGPVFFVSDAMMSEAKTITFSQYYRTRAEDCRARGNLFRDPGARAEMFKLAIEYDSRQRKPRLARSICITRALSGEHCTDVI